MARKKNLKDVDKETMEFINEKFNNNNNDRSTSGSSKNYAVKGKELDYKIKIKCKSDEQIEFLKSIENNDITLCTGKAGVGKTYIAMGIALDLLQKDNQFKKIYIIKPAVEAEEKIGSLPGSLQEKLDPHIFSYKLVTDELIGQSNRKYLFAQETIEPLGLGFLRGITLTNCILIADEMQNSTITQMKTLLTRCGNGCKMIIMGDTNQIDNTKVNKKTSGLVKVMDSLKDIDGIGVMEFKNTKSVRHPLIDVILERLEKE